MNTFQKFFQVNRHFCRKIEKLLPQATPNILSIYNETVSSIINLRQKTVVLDLGCGLSVPYTKYLKNRKGVRIVGVDISRQALNNNRDIDEKLLSNLEKPLPLAINSVDVISCRWTIEHIRNLDTFLNSCNKVIKKEGFFIGLSACRFSPFAIINRTLPKNLSAKILYFLNPNIKDKVGLPSFYKNGNNRTFKDLLNKHEFKIIKVYFGFYQSQYFDFFLPFYLISVFYELIIWKLKIYSFAPYLLFVAAKIDQKINITQAKKNEF